MKPEPEPRSKNPERANVGNDHFCLRCWGPRWLLISRWSEQRTANSNDDDEGDGNLTNYNWLYTRETGQFVWIGSNGFLIALQFYDFEYFIEWINGLRCMGIFRLCCTNVLTMYIKTVWHYLWNEYDWLIQCFSGSLKHEKKIMIKSCHCQHYLTFNSKNNAKNDLRSVRIYGPMYEFTVLSILHFFLFLVSSNNHKRISTFPILGIYLQFEISKIAKKYLK